MKKMEKGMSMESMSDLHKGLERKRLTGDSGMRLGSRSVNEGATRESCPETHSIPRGT